MAQDILELQKRILIFDHELGTYMAKMSKIRNSSALPSILDDTIFEDKLPGEKIYRWGKNNMFPQILGAAVEDTPILQSGLEIATKLTYGQGVYTYKKVANKDKKIYKEEITSPELDMLFDNSVLPLYLSKVSSDFRIFAHAFAIIRTNEAGDLITRIEVAPTPDCRYMKPGKSGIINEIVVSKMFCEERTNIQLLKSNIKEYVNKGYAKIFPLISIYDPVASITEHVKNGHRAFVYPIYDYSATANPYHKNALQAAYNSGWIDIARIVPFLKKKSMTQAISLKQAVGYNVDDFPEYFGISSNASSVNSIATPTKPGLDPISKKEALKTFQDDIEKNLVGAENHDTTMFFPFKYDTNGKMIKALDFINIEKNTIDKELISDAMHSHSVCLESIGVDMTLLGHGMPGSTMGSGASGSNKRNAVEIFQIGAALTRELFMMPYKVAQVFNKVDSSICTGFRDLELTTLNDNPNGIQTKQ